ncbi:hypothetical protein KEF29_29460 [Streptomyces tuirus]|uniref:Uncharacterized protein n=1 Tax=Streptomyces tuirus TaxID=68278 RepID=A0A941FIF7_9ACTN|nr:hypothetical protein [Streptomyces tuirus]
MPPQSAIVEAMKETLEDAHRYPDLPYVELRDTVPAHIGRSSDRTAVATGFPAMLRDIARASSKTESEAIFPEPSFAADLPGHGRM